MKNLIQRSKKNKNGKKQRRTLEEGDGGELITARVCASVHFMLEAGQCGHTDLGVYVGNSINGAFS